MDPRGHTRDTRMRREFLPKGEEAGERLDYHLERQF
jgi:hypothetical protein